VFFVLILSHNSKMGSSEPGQQEIRAFTLEDGNVEIYRSDNIPRLTIISEELRKENPKPEWESTIKAEEVDEIRFVSDDKVLVSLVKLKGITARPSNTGLSLLDVNSGKTVWTHPFKTFEKGTHSVVATNPVILYLGANDKKAVFTALDPKNGEVAWEHEVKVPQSHLVSDSRKSIVIASKAGGAAEVVALNLQDGKEFWTNEFPIQEFGKSLRIMMRMTGSYVYIAGRKIHKLSLDDGHPVWSGQFSELDEFPVSMKVTYEGIIAFNERMLKLLDLQTGKELWRYIPQNKAIKGVSSFLGNLFVYAEEKDAHHIIAVDGGTGKAAWSHTASDEINSILFFHEGKLYYTTRDDLVSLDAVSGEVSFKSSFPEDLKKDGVLPDLIKSDFGKIFIAREETGLAAFSLGSGELAFYHRWPGALQNYTTWRVIWDLEYIAENRVKKEKIRMEIDLMYEEMREEIRDSYYNDSQAAVEDIFNYALIMADSRPSAAMAAQPQRAQDSTYVRMAQRYRENVRGRGGIEEEIGIKGLSVAQQVQAAGDRLMATVDLCNTLINFTTALVDAIQAAVAQAEISRRQAELPAVIRCHSGSFQGNYYVRPIFRFGRGLTIVDLSTGEASEVIHSPDDDLLDNSMSDTEFDIPIFVFDPERKKMITAGIGMDPSLYKLYVWSDSLVPYSSVLCYDIDTFLFKKEDPENYLLPRLADSEKNEEVKKLLDKGVDVNVRNDDGNTALIEAVNDGNVELVKMLLQAGANPNLKNDSGTALHLILNPYYAKVKGEIIKLLLDAGADFNLKNVNWYTPVELAHNFGDSGSVRLFVERGASAPKTTTFSEAIHRGDIESAEAFLMRGVNPDVRLEDGDPPLKAAASRGYTEIVKLLLKHRGWTDRKNKSTGRTAIFDAALNGHTEIVRLLIQADAEINANDKGKETPLMVAALGGHPDVVKLLIEAGAEVNAKDKKGQTVLDKMLSQSGDEAQEIIELLKRAGATTGKKK
jgi:ankyrin repeat protein/outer membrane protein assembly factor BamB